jgi:hypothetical protein
MEHLQFGSFALVVPFQFSPQVGVSAVFFLIFGFAPTIDSVARVKK